MDETFFLNCERVGALCMKSFWIFDTKSNLDEIIADSFWLLANEIFVAFCRGDIMNEKTLEFCQ